MRWTCDFHHFVSLKLNYNNYYYYLGFISYLDDSESKYIYIGFV